MMDNYMKPQIMPLTYSSGVSPYVLAAGIVWIPILAGAIVVVGGALWVWVAGQVQLGVHFQVVTWTKVWVYNGE